MLKCVGAKPVLGEWFAYLNADENVTLSFEFAHTLMCVQACSHLSTHAPRTLTLSHCETMKCATNNALPQKTPNANGIKT